MVTGLLITVPSSSTEAFRQGTEVNPGVAIKISTEPNGIYDDKDELDFSYTIDQNDHTKVWIAFSTVRGKPFNGDFAVRTCHGSNKSPNVPTHECNITDEVELILCGSKATTAERDPTPVDVLVGCAGPWWKKRDGAAGQSRLCRGQIASPNNGTATVHQDSGSHAPQKVAKSAIAISKESLIREAASSLDNFATLREWALALLYYRTLLELSCDTIVKKYFPDCDGFLSRMTQVGNMIEANPFQGGVRNSTI
jgi:hypothetical protein